MNIPLDIFDKNTAWLHFIAHAYVPRDEGRGGIYRLRPDAARARAPSPQAR